MAVERNIKNATDVDSDRIVLNLRPILLSLFSGVLYGLSFPPFNLSFLAWFALVPLLFISFKSKREALTLGLLTGFVANALIYFWIWATFRAAGVGFLTTFFSWISLSLVLGVTFLVFSTVYFFMPDVGLKPVSLGFLWVCLNAIQSFVLSGFPWAFLGTTQADNLPFIQVASATGLAGVTFFLIWSNASISQFLKYLILKRKRNAMFLNLGFLIFSVLAVHVWGTNRLNTSGKKPESTVRIAILQGNIDQYQKWDDQHESDIRHTYKKLAMKAATEKPSFIVWPESSIPGWYPNEKFYLNWVEDLVKETNISHVIGAVSRVGKKEYNSMFHVDSKGKIQNRYDKQHLVPFGEYVPFAKLLRPIVPFLGQLGEFDAGQGNVLFDIKGIKIAPNICYESIFPNLVRKSVLKGADIIMNVTNDGWYLDTGAPEQHYVNNIFRAIEMGRPVVRAANTGISAVIDPFGREQLRSPLLEENVYTSTLFIPKDPMKTFYLIIGDWFAWFSFVFLFSILFWICILPSCHANSKIKSRA